MVDDRRPTLLNLTLFRPVVSEAVVPSSSMSTLNPGIGGDGNSDVVIDLKSTEIVAESSESDDQVFWQNWTVTNDDGSREAGYDSNTALLLDAARENSGTRGGSSSRGVTVNLLLALVAICAWSMMMNRCVGDT